MRQEALQCRSETVGRPPCFGGDDDQGDGKSSNEQEARIFNQRTNKVTGHRLFFVLI